MSREWLSLISGSAGRRGRGRGGSAGYLALHRQRADGAAWSLARRSARRSAREPSPDAVVADAFVVVVLAHTVQLALLPRQVHLSIAALHIEERAIALPTSRGPQATLASAGGSGRCSGSADCGRDPGDRSARTSATTLSRSDGDF